MKRVKRVLTCLGLFLVFGLVLQNADGAISPEAEEKLLDEACHELVCLCGCGNMVLNTCTCGKAAEWKNFLRQQIRQGKNKEQLLQIMADKYGEKVLAAPPKEGLNWILWVVVPYIVPVIGAIALALLLTKWVKQRKIVPSEGERKSSAPAGQESAGSKILQQYEKQLEDELKDFEE